MMVKMMRFKVGTASYQLLYLIQNLERMPALKILETLWKELLLSQINQRLTGGLGAEARRRNTGREADHHRHHQGDTKTLQGQNLLWQRDLVVLPASQSRQVLEEVLLGLYMVEANQSSMRLID